jgi:hypothetical protein
LFVSETNPQVLTSFHSKRFDWPLQIKFLFCDVVQMHQISDSPCLLYEKDKEMKNFFSKKGNIWGVVELQKQEMPEIKCFL